MASGGLAGGLADGISNGLQLYMQSKYYGGLNDARDERNRILAEKEAAQEAARASGKGVNFDEFDKAILPMFGGGKPANFADKMKPAPMGSSAGLGPATLPNVGALSGSAPAAYQSGTLGDIQRPAPPDPDEDLSPRQRIVKGIMSGNLANDPDKLNAINAAAVMSGVGKEVTPWLEGLYKAKKTGLFDAAMDLKRGNIDGAMDNLKRGGIALEDRPVKVNPDDPNSGQWKVNIPGTGEQVIDIDNWATSMLDPKDYAKFTLDRQETGQKGRVADSEVRENDSTVGLNVARTGKANAEARNIKNSGSLVGLGKAPRVVKTVETNQGIVAVMSNGHQNLLKGADGKPLFGTANLKVAAGLVGKTLDPFSDNNNIADRVNAMAGQLGGGKNDLPVQGDSDKRRVLIFGKDFN